MKNLLLLVFVFLFASCGSSNHGKGVGNEAKSERHPAGETAISASAKDNEVLGATPVAIDLYDMLKNGLYEKTLSLIAKEEYDDFSEQDWISYFKEQDKAHGMIVKYELEKSQVNQREAGQMVARLTFKVRRQHATFKETISFIKQNGTAHPYLINDYEAKVVEGKR